MNKKLIPVNLVIESNTDNMDADDLGCRITECIRDCTPSSNIVNLVKLYTSPTTRLDTLSYLIKNIKEAFTSAGVKNVIFVPLGNDLVDIKIDYLKIVEEEDVNVTEEY